MTIEELTWDSDFFGVKTGRCLLNDKDKWEQEKLSQWDLVYFFVDPEHYDAIQRLKELNAALVDQKVTFIMDLSGLGADNFLLTDIYSYYKDSKLYDVIDIGIQSGVYSRFSQDINIPKNKFEELYTLWMRRSIDREIAREVFIYKSDKDEIGGVITLGNKNDRSDIGIIAVDEKFRGHGVGKKLVKAGIKNSLEAGYKMLQVVTQKNNNSACRFYEQCGFIVEKVVNIYHYWNKR
jgi:dTDP-4-amino-4,6-dideoxy-D-galactose acyltransferase